MVLTIFSYPMGDYMKKYLIFMVIALATAFPFAASAQSNNSFGNFYGVVEAGITKNSFTASGTFNNLITDNRSGEAFGASLGYRYFYGESLVLGIEGNFATSGGSSFSQDSTSTLLVETDYVYGGYFTLGGRFGQNKNTFIYGLVGFAGTSIDETATFVGSTNVTTTSENGTGFSFGGAVETGITDNLGVRVKGLYNMYKQGASGTKIRDVSIMAGLVFNF